MDSWETIDWLSNFGPEGDFFLSDPGYTRERGKQFEASFKRKSALTRRGRT